MSDGFEIEIDGLKELADAMDALPPRVARSAVRPALNAAGQVFKAAVLSTVPRDTGQLASSIKSKVHVSNDLSSMSVIVGPEYSGGGTQDPGVRAKFLEFGTRKMHPQPFMRRAFAASKNAALSAALSVLKAIMENLK